MSEAMGEPTPPQSQQDKTSYTRTSQAVSFAEGHELIEIPRSGDETVLDDSRGRSSIRFRRLSSFDKEHGIVSFKSNKFDIETGKPHCRECVITEVLRHQHPMHPRDRWQKQLFGSFFEKSQARDLRASDSDVAPSSFNSSMRSVGEASLFSESGDTSSKQFRIRTNKNEGLTCCQRFFGDAEDDRYLFSHDPNSHRRFSSVMNRFLNWTFRTSFLVLVTVQFIQWCFIVMIFAAIIYGFGVYDPNCIQVGDKNFDKGVFMDAVALSWTTFSTVGYGLIYPQVSSNKITRCVGINMLMTLESFIGVLFGAMAGAIIYGKVSRIQSLADVEFSDPMVVRYGSGCVEDHPKNSPSGSRDESSQTLAEGAVTVPTDSSDTQETSAKDNESEEAGEKDDNDEELLPCPVLEFRILNKAWRRSRGEIINSSVKCVSSILAKDASESVRNAVGGGSGEEFVLIRRFPRLMGTTTISEQSMETIRASPEASSKGSDRSTPKGRMTALTSWMVDPIRRTTKDYVYNPIKKNVDYWRDVQQINEADLEADRPIPRARSKQQPAAVPSPMSGVLEVEEDAAPKPVEHILIDEGSKLVPRIIFSSMQLDTSDHPFFKRVWVLRHTLNADSPLLRTAAKRKVIENGGYWPESLNSYQAVRNSISFHKIIVSFCGTSNATGSCVYKQKTYSYVDMNIGYAFARVMHWDNKGKLAVDSHLLNDVVVQQGGGAEPFDVDEHGIRGLVNNLTGAAQQGVTAAVDGIEVGATRIANIVQKIGQKEEGDGEHGEHRTTNQANSGKDEGRMGNRSVEDLGKDDHKRKDD